MVQQSSKCCSEGLQTCVFVPSHAGSDLWNYFTSKAALSQDHFLLINRGIMKSAEMCGVRRQRSQEFRSVAAIFRAVNVNSAGV